MPKPTVSNSYDTGRSTSPSARFDCFILSCSSVLLFVSHLPALVEIPLKSPLSGQDEKKKNLRFIRDSYFIRVADYFYHLYTHGMRPNFSVGISEILPKLDDY